jgi:hypothetical protein
MGLAHHHQVSHAVFGYKNWLIIPMAEIGDFVGPISQVRYGPNNWHNILLSFILIKIYHKYDIYQFSTLWF